MHTTYRFAIAVAIVACVAASATPAAAQAVKIGVFDPTRVSEEAADAKRLQGALATIRDTKQADIAQKEATITELRQRLQQQALSLSADKRTSMEFDIQRKVLELNTAKDLANQQLQLEFAAAEASFNDRLTRVVQQYGRDNGFAVILDANAVAFASTAIDVTTPIIDLFNTMYPGPEGSTESGSSE